MPLKQVAVKTTGPAPSKKSTDIPSFAAKEALDLSRYAQAVRDMKEAERLVAELEPGIKAEALHQLFGHNVSHTDKPVATVRLVAEGEGDNVAVVRVSFQDKYSAPNVELADAMFQELRTTEGKPGDINDYLQQAVGAKFDAKVFISAIGKDKGEFSKPVYDAYRKVLEKATAELIARGYLAEGTACPLSTFPTVAVRAGFHDQRWSAFPRVADQERISEVVKNTVTATVE